MNELTYTVPKGYEIDMEKSDFKNGNIVMKELPKKRILKWKDLDRVEGFFLRRGNYSHCFCENFENIDNFKTVFYSKEYAESALAFAQLSQVYQHYDKSEYNGLDCYYGINVKNKDLSITVYDATYQFWRFKTYKEAQLFLDNNRELLEKFYMIK